MKSLDDTLRSIIRAEVHAALRPRIESPFPFGASPTAKPLGPLAELGWRLAAIEARLQAPACPALDGGAVPRAAGPPRSDGATYEESNYSSLVSKWTEILHTVNNRGPAIGTRAKRAFAAVEKRNKPYGVTSTELAEELVFPHRSEVPEDVKTRIFRENRGTWACIKATAGNWLRHYTFQEPMLVRREVTPQRLTQLPTSCTYEYYPIKGEEK